jgi:hypothetical protein
MKIYELTDSEWEVIKRMRDVNAMRERQLQIESDMLEAVSKFKPFEGVPLVYRDKHLLSEDEFSLFQYAVRDLSNGVNGYARQIVFGIDKTDF